ncbi:MAG: hypothetical protein BGO43_11275 [Gammaproteobacteria bacterium 39-13]|nr:hypothetical protein [Gammaproteobacteria bacterium]OJV85216.1 MAG: hypothetical protein BGO43_11275 [Gammaproteobacteria bacterium 39-13]
MKSNPTNYRSFPWWYSWVKWMLPLTLAISTGAVVGFTITGAIASYEMFQWAPLLFASLQGPAAVAFLTLAITSVSSIVGIVSSFFVRAGLFHLTENIATQNLEYANRLQDLLSEKDVSFAEEREEMQKALSTENKQREKVMQDYYLLRGRLAVAPLDQGEKRKKISPKEIIEEEASEAEDLGEETPKRQKKVLRK